jgi:two-component system, sensor histidine kinase ChiS
LCNRFRSNRLFTNILIFGLLSACLLVAGCKPFHSTPQAVDGVMDLTGWNFTTNGTVALSGQWEFYWHHLYSPEDFLNMPATNAADLITMPSLWTHHTANENRLDADGYATYRLCVHVAPSETPMALSLGNIRQAYRLWANGVPVGSDGRVAVHGNREMRGVGNNPFVPLPLSASRSGTLELVLQVSNHSHWSGGADSQFARFGTAGQIKGRQTRQHRFKVVAVTILFSIAVYHLLLFFFRPKDFSTLYFSMFCLLWMIQAIASSDFSWMLSFWFPDYRPLVFSHIEMSAYFLAFPFLLPFLNSLFPEEGFKRIPWIHFSAVALLSILHLMNAQTRYVATVGGHMSAIFSMTIYFIIVPRAMRRKRPASALMFCGGLSLVLCGLNDIPYDLQLIHTGFYYPVGLLLMIFFQACALAHRFSKAFSDTEMLSEKLHSSNIALKRLNRLKDDFLTHTSHELRTPLNGIIGMAEALQTERGTGLTEQDRSRLDLIVASGKRLVKLIGNVLDYSRLRHKDIELHRSPVDVNGVARPVLAICRELARGKNITVENRLPADLPPVEADGDRLQQILFNLVGNAIKFTENGSVSLFAERREKMLEISVTDTGSGIPDEDLPRIFDPFEQAVSEESPDRSGTGLGLPITRKLVELHGGKIWATSQMGKGSVFTFTLPVSTGKAAFTPPPVIDLPTPPHAAEHMPPPTADNRTAHAHTILVVDDEPLNCQVVAAHLSRENILPRTVSNGQDAIEAVARGPLPDLVLLDILMPGMNGYEVCRKLREIHSASALPIIMLTALDRITELAMGFEAGANDYITKPFSRQELLARIGVQIKLKNAYETLRENMTLKRELSLRKQTELDLRLMQRKLSAMLHRVEDAMVAVNTSGEISFCNRAFEVMTGFDAGDLIGNPVDDLFPSRENRPLLAAFKPAEYDPAPAEKTLPFRNVGVKHSAGGDFSADLLVTPLSMDDASFHMVIVRKPSRAGDTAALSSLSTIDRLNRNEARIQALTGILERFQAAGEGAKGPDGEALSDIDMWMARLAGSEPGENSGAAKREMAVRIMNLSLDYWQLATRTTKTELADRSGLWRIYIEKDGYARTQTLDKYLSLQTLPAHPRWKKVCNTAEFVLTACTFPSPGREDLEASLSRFRSLL